MDTLKCCWNMQWFQFMEKEIERPRARIKILGAALLQGICSMFTGYSPLYSNINANILLQQDIPAQSQIMFCCSRFSFRPICGSSFRNAIRITREFSATRSYATRPSTIQNGDAYRDGTGNVVWLCNNGNSWCLCCEVVATASYTCETEQPTWLDSAPHDTLPRIILFRICRRLIATHTTRLCFVTNELAEREVQNTNSRPSH